MRTRAPSFRMRVNVKFRMSVARWFILWLGLVGCQAMLCSGIARPQQDQPPSSAGQTRTDEQNPPSVQPNIVSPAPQTNQPKADVLKPQASSAPQKPSRKRVTRKHPAKKQTPVKKSVPADHAGKVVVRNGGAKDDSGQLAPAMTQEQELHSRENTAQLLATTDSNLKAIAGRQLSDSQQGMLNQIHTYVRQSRVASDAGDLPRAHTLAFKAHLLSDELTSK